MQILDAVRTTRVKPWLVPMLAALLIGCGAGKGDSSDANGGMVGFATGNETAGAVPSDGSDPAAPVVVSVSASNPRIESGQPLRIEVTFTDQQGDVATLHFGIAGQSTHSTLSADLVGAKTTGTLLLDLVPKSYTPGTYTLVVSMTDRAGHTSGAVSVTFTIVGVGGSRVDGAPVVDAGSKVDPDAGTVAAVDAAKPGDGANATGDTLAYWTDTATPLQPDAPASVDVVARGDGASTTGDVPVGGKDVAVDRAYEAGETANPTHGVYTLVSTEQVSVPVSDESTEIIEAGEGFLEIRQYHNIGGKPGEFRTRGTFSLPPAVIEPGAVWPISGTLKVISNVNPIDWKLYLQGNTFLGYIFSGVTSLDSNSDPAGTVYTLNAVEKAPTSKQDFDLGLYVSTGATGTQYRYHYKWNP